MKATKTKLVVYLSHIVTLGGIETAVKTLLKCLPKDKYDITLVYDTAQGYTRLFDLSKYADIIKLQPTDSIECDVCLIASNFTLPKQIHSKKNVQWIHADYEKYSLQLKINPNTTYVAVSKWVANVAKKLFKVDCEVIYNLVDPDFGLKTDEKVLRLVTNTRISPEKGLKRMLQLCHLLRNEGINFSWAVYGNNGYDKKYQEQAIAMFNEIQEVSFLGYTADVSKGLKNADYHILLSDFEGCPYAVVEALTLGVPCIVTEFPSAYELVQDGVNGYIVPFSMQGIDIKRIAEHIPKGFEHKPLSTIEQWTKKL